MFTLLAVSVQGCGGSSPDSEHHGFVVRTETAIEARELSRNEFLNQIQTFCRVAWSSLPEEFTSALGRSAKGKSTSTRYEEAMRNIVLRGLGFHIFDAFRILGSPPNEERPVEEIAGALQEAIERGQRLNPIGSMKELSARFRTFSRLAARYGLKDCTVTAAHLKL